MKKSKMKKYSLLILLITLFTSCSSDDDGNENNQSNFTINNVYLENYLDNSPSNCWTDLIITDGSLSELNNSYQANSDINNVIFFNDLLLENCEFNTPVEWIWDETQTSDPNFGMESPNPIENITILNNSLENYSDLTELVFYAKLSFQTNTSFSYEIRLSNGRVLNGSFSGSITEKDRLKDIEW